MRPVLSFIILALLSSPAYTQSSTSLNAATTSGSLPASSSVNATATSTAEFPNLSGYSMCVLNCLGLSVSAANCTSEIAVNCFCKSPTFTKEMVICISSSCPTQLASAESLAQQFCNLASTSTSLSFPFASVNVTSSVTPTPSPPTTTPAPSSTVPTVSQSAARGPWNVSWGLVVSVGVGVIGVVYGVFIV